MFECNPGYINNRYKSLMDSGADLSNMERDEYTDMEEIIELDRTPNLEVLKELVLIV